MSSLTVHSGPAPDVPVSPPAAEPASPTADDMAAIDRDIAELEARLQAAKLRRQQMGAPSQADTQQKTRQKQQQQQHFLFLLSDSALPLGSFAFSSGLESFLAHDKAATATNAFPAPAGGKTGQAAFAEFLPLSVASYAHSSLPFVLAGHGAATTLSSSSNIDAFTSTLVALDDTYDATIICTVGRRASVAQGRALLSVWERAFAPTLLAAAAGTGTHQQDPLRPFSLLVKRSSHPAPGCLPEASAHMPPLFGAVAALAGLDRRQAADIVMLAHVKALVSAAVRANLLGPYQAQKLLASAAVQGLVVQAVEGAWDVAVEDAGQTMPVVDLWMGRHEMLYSRIFNS